MHTQGKIGCGSGIHGDYNRTTQRTTQECRHPFGRVRAPDEDTISLSDSTLCKFTGKLKRTLSHLLVGPVQAAVTAALDVGTLLPSLQEIIQVFDKRAALHG